MKKTILTSAISFVAGGVICGSVAIAGTNLVQAQKVPSNIVINGHAYNNVPRLVYGGSSYVQLWSIQQGLKNSGFTATWDGTTFNVQSPPNNGSGNNPGSPQPIMNDPVAMSHFSSPSLTEFTVDGQTFHLTLDNAFKGPTGALLVGYHFTDPNEYVNLLGLMVNGGQEDVRSAINNLFAPDATSFASQHGYTGYGVGLYFEGDFDTYPSAFDPTCIHYNSSTGKWHVYQCFSMTTNGVTQFYSNGGHFYVVKKAR